MIAKYLATSFAIEKVVSAPRVINNCFPIATTSMSLVGLLSKSTMLPASFAAIVPVFIAKPTSACQRRCIVGAIASHGHQAAFMLFAFDVFKLVGRRSLCNEIIYSSFGRNGSRSKRIVPGDHNTSNPHLSELENAFLDSAFHYVFQVDDTECPPRSATARGVPPVREMRSQIS